MKKLALLFLSLILFQQNISAAVSVFSQNNKFGLKDETGAVITDAKYKKLVRLGERAWIMQSGNRFGIIDDKGDILVKPTYSRAERVLGKYAKFKKGDRYGIFDEYGAQILNTEFSSIDLLYGGMYVTCLNHKYGIYTVSGYLVVDNVFDDIYMPDRDTLVMVYGDEVYEFKRKENEAGIPFDILFPSQLDKNYLNISDIASSPIATTSYYGVTLTDYMLKIISSISPAYEETIDELMYSQGADTVSALMKCLWIPMFPFVYAKKYYQNIANPYSGPLGGAKKSLLKHIKD